MPYTGSTGRLADVWQVTRDNLTRVFQTSPKTIALPNTAPQMQELTDVTATSFTSDDILAIANKHRDTPSAGATASFYIVFLAGYYDDGTGRKRTSLASRSAAPASSACSSPPSRAPTAAASRASSNSRRSCTSSATRSASSITASRSRPNTKTLRTAPHCTNEKCAMYWSNEGASAAVAFVRQVLLTGSNVLYGSECLADVDAVAQ